MRSVNSKLFLSLASLILSVSSSVLGGAPPSKSGVVAGGTVLWRANLSVHSSDGCSVAGTGLAADSVGNSYIGGCTLSKISPSGSILWSVPMKIAPAEGFVISGYSRPIAVDPQGNPLLIHSIVGPGDIYKGVVSKYNPSGELIWRRIYDRGVGLSSITVDALGNIFVAGEVAPVNGNSYAVEVMRLDSLGNQVWVKQIASVFGGSGLEGVAVSNQGVVVTTYTGARLLNLDNGELIVGDGEPLCSAVSVGPNDQVYALSSYLNTIHRYDFSNGVYSSIDIRYGDSIQVSPATRQIVADPVSGDIYGTGLVADATGKKFFFRTAKIRPDGSIAWQSISRKQGNGQAIALVSDGVIAGGACADIFGMCVMKYAK